MNFFPEEHDPAQLVFDNDYVLSYFSGVELSVINPRSKCWTTELFPNGLSEDDAIPTLAKTLTGVQNGRTAPAMLNKDTMFYSYANFEADVSGSCIWRATATGDYPDKTWTEDPEPVTCTTSQA